MLSATFEDLLRQIVREELERVVERLLAAKPAAADERLSKTQAAAVAGVSPATIDKWVQRGDLKRYGEGKAVRFSRAEVLTVASRPTSTPSVSPEDRALAHLRKVHG